MEGPIKIEVPRPPLVALAKLFLHSRSCPECAVRFWALIGMQHSGMAMMHTIQKQPIRAWIRLQIAYFATRRRVVGMRALGVKPFEDMSPSEQQAAIAEMHRFQRSAEKDPERASRLH